LLDRRARRYSAVNERQRSAGRKGRAWGRFPIDLWVTNSASRHLLRMGIERKAPLLRGWFRDAPTPRIRRDPGAPKARAPALGWWSRAGSGSGDPLGLLRREAVADLSHPSAAPRRLHGARKRLAAQRCSDGRRGTRASGLLRRKSNPSCRPASGAFLRTLSQKWCAQSRAAAYKQQNGARNPEPPGRAARSASIVGPGLRGAALAGSAVFFFGAGERSLALKRFFCAAATKV